MERSTPGGPTDNYGDLSITSALANSAYTGAATGTAGLLLGSVVGVLRSPHPVLFSVGSGVQCFGLGAVYAFTRQTLLFSNNSHPSVFPSSARRETAVSTVSGAVAGASVAGLVRGRANVLPGALVWGIAGLVGQEAWHFRNRDAWKRQEEEEKERRRRHESNGMGKGDDGKHMPFWLRMSPIKVLTDDEYEAMLKERLLRIDADIAIVDEDLAALRQQQENSSSRGEEANGGDIRSL